MTTPEESLADLAVSHGARLAARPEVSGTVDVIVGTADADRRVRLEWTDGRVTGASALPALPAGAATKARSSRAKSAPAGSGAAGPAVGSADLTLTVAADLARALVSGEVRPSVAFMRGTLKTSGSNGLVLGVLAAVDGGGPERAFGAWAADAAKLAG